MKKCKCGNDLFRIREIECCSDCSENGAWDDDLGEYTYNEKIIMEMELERNEVEDQGQCRKSIAYGDGCEMTICSKCRQEIVLVLRGGW